ncbi:hypothetical protein [Oceanispirochaeta sp. M1]|uniref:hypothetical protein n=1 Tax=Oceanispirochaeta sp. M1 TaxID=2283433 RepID=UPI0020A6695E|nr:hypothetical protein [Oceanispirochaeta sp. M1]
MFPSDTQDVKKYLKFFLLLTIMLSVSKPVDLHAYKILYAEQFYRLYHQHFYQYPEDTMENIHYLGMALRSDFANPLNALATIENEKEWEKYRYLFYMHVNLKLVDSYLKLGMKYDKRNAYFYNYPWKFSNLDSLETAEECYRYALNFWEDAIEWSDKAAEHKFAWMFIEEIQFWEDESFRIQTGDLNYQKTINRELDRLQKVREAFEAMDQNTY